MGREYFKCKTNFETNGIKDGECIRNFIRKPVTKALPGRRKWACGDQCLNCIEQKYDERVWFNIGLIRVALILQKSRRHLRILDARRVT